MKCSFGPHSESVSAWVFSQISLSFVKVGIWWDFFIKFYYDDISCFQCTIPIHLALNNTKINVQHWYNENLGDHYWQDLHFECG